MSRTGRSTQHTPGEGQAVEGEVRHAEEVRDPYELRVDAVAGGEFVDDHLRLED